MVPKSVKDLVLVIKNDFDKAEPYIAFFQLKNFDVVFLKNAKEVLDFFAEKPHSRIAFIVLDLKLKHSEEFSRTETGNGEKTGLVLFDFLKLNGKNCVSIFIIENMSDVNVLQNDQNIHSDSPVYFFVESNNDPSNILNKLEKIKC